MGSKTRLGSYCTKRANNGVNLVTSRNINTRLARPIVYVFSTLMSFTYQFTLTDANAREQKPFRFGLRRQALTPA